VGSFVEANLRPIDKKTIRSVIHKMRKSLVMQMSNSISVKACVQLFSVVSHSYISGAIVHLPEHCLEEFIEFLRKFLPPDAVSVLNSALSVSDDSDRTVIAGLNETLSLFRSKESSH